MTTHSSILAWRIPWTEEPGWLQYIVSQRVLKFKKSFHGLDAFSIPEKTVIRNG